MAHEDNGDRHTDPKHTFIGIPELMERYGCKRTAAYALVKRKGFPRPVAPGKWRLDHVMEQEDDVARGGEAA